LALWSAKGDRTWQSASDEEQAGSEIEAAFALMVAMGRAMVEDDTRPDVSCRTRSRFDASGTAGAHRPRNCIARDTRTEFAPWEWSASGENN